MSERKGGAHSSKRVRVNISEEFGDKLTALTQSSHMDKKTMIEFFIALSEKYGLHKPGFAERLNESLDLVDAVRDHKNAHDEYLKTDECPALAEGKKKSGDLLFRCVWYRPDAPPNIKNLGDSDSLQETACLSCGGTRPYVEGIEVRDQKIAELETELRGRAEEIFKVPKCNAGADLRNDKEDQLVFHNCRKHPQSPVSVEKWCRVYQGGLPCMMFAQVTVGASERL